MVAAPARRVLWGACPLGRVQCSGPVQSEEGIRLAQVGEALKSLFRSIRRRLVRLALPALLLYMTIFRTSLIWHVAAPLGAG